MRNLWNVLCTGAAALLVCHSAMAQNSSIMLAQASPYGAPGSYQPNYILKDCTNTTSLGDPNSADRGIDPAMVLVNALNSRSIKAVVSDLDAIRNVTMLQNTVHGKFVAHTGGSGRPYYMYEPPTPGYQGEDEAVFSAEFQGKRYKIIVTINIYAVPALPQDLDTCPNPKLIKVVKPSKRSTG